MADDRVPTAVPRLPGVIAKSPTAIAPLAVAVADCPRAVDPPRLPDVPATVPLPTATDALLLTVPPETACAYVNARKAITIATAAPLHTQADVPQFRPLLTTIFAYVGLVLPIIRGVTLLAVQVYH